MDARHLAMIGDGRLGASTGRARGFKAESIRRWRRKARGGHGRRRVNPRAFKQHRRIAYRAGACFGSTEYCAPVAADGLSDRDGGKSPAV